MQHDSLFPYYPTALEKKREASQAWKEILNLTENTHTRNLHATAISRTTNDNKIWEAQKEITYKTFIQLGEETQDKPRKTGMHLHST